MPTNKRKKNVVIANHANVNRADLINTEPRGHRPKDAPVLIEQ